MTACIARAKLTLATVPAEDPAVYDMICAADTIGVFQIESRAQMSMLPRLKPQCFYDLVIEVAIVRPGPIQGGMVHPYLRRRSRQEPVTYPHPLVEEVLSKTLGVPLFQEQVMRLAIVAAGFTPGEADQLRRAMGAWRRSGIIEKFRDKFLDGMLAHGLPIGVRRADLRADQGLRRIRLSRIARRQLRPARLCVGVAQVPLSRRVHGGAHQQPADGLLCRGATRPRCRSSTASRSLPIDVNHSEWDCTLEFLPSPLRGRGAGGEGAGVSTNAMRNEEVELDDPTSSFLIPHSSFLISADGNAAPSPPAPLPRREEGRIRLGFRLIKGFAESHAAAIVAARHDAAFRSVADFARRGHVSKALLARLAAADAFRSLGLDRRTALWKVLATGEDLPLFAGLDDDDQRAELAGDVGPAACHRRLPGRQGSRSRPIRLSLIRGDLDRLNVVSAKGLAELPDKATVRIAGLVLVRQRPPTANGTVFMSLEDETGMMNLIIWRRTWERFRKVAKAAVALYIEGKVERADRVIHVCPTKIEDLSYALLGLASGSRDFR